MGEITITPVLSSGTPIPIVIPFRQIGVPGISLTLADAVSVDNTAGRLLIGVDVLGAGVRWKVSATTNPTGFLTFPGTVTTGDGTSATASAGTDGDVLTLVYSENNETERVATLTFEAVDGDGNSYTPKATQVLTITQAGALPTLLVTQTGGPDVTALSANAEIAYAVTIGGGAKSWSASVTRNPGGFLMVSESGDGFQGGCG